VVAGLVGSVSKTHKSMVMLTQKSMLTQKGLVTNNVLDSSEVVCVCWKCLVSWPLRFSDVPDLLRFAGFKASCLPSLRVSPGYPLSVLDCSRNVYAWKSLYACCFMQGAVGTWILVPWWWSIHSPFYKPKCSLQVLTQHIFL